MVIYIKKFLIKIAVLGLMIFILLMTGCSKNISAKIKGLKFEDVKSVRIELAYGGGSQVPKIYTFDFNNSDHTKIIKNIVSYLNSAKVQGNADEKTTNKGGSPTFLILVLKDGSVIQIKPAVGGKVTKFSNGVTEISQFDIPNEVTISTNFNKKPIRIFSPEIRRLIDSGYKGIFGL